VTNFYQSFLHEEPLNFPVLELHGEGFPTLCQDIFINLGSQAAERLGLEAIQEMERVFMTSLLRTSRRGVYFYYM